MDVAWTLCVLNGGDFVITLVFPGCPFLLPSQHYLMHLENKFKVDVHRHKSWCISFSPIAEWTELSGPPITVLCYIKDIILRWEIVSGDILEVTCTLKLNYLNNREVLSSWSTFWGMESSLQLFSQDKPIISSSHLINASECVRR